MPSVLVGNQSGGQPIISGYPWSGIAPTPPIGGIQLRWDPNASGFCYIALSGRMTVGSGGLFQSGTAYSGLLDGMVLTPGDPYWLPRLVCGPSGSINIRVLCDAAASGQARLYYEVF